MPLCNEDFVRFPKKSTSADLFILLSFIGTGQEWNLLVRQKWNWSSVALFFFWTTSSVQMPFSFFSEFDQLSFLKSFQERTSGTQEVMHLVCLAETLSLEKVE